MIERVLGGVRAIGLDDKGQIGKRGERLAVDRHAADRGLECIHSGDRNSLHRHVMRRPDHHDARDGSRSAPQRRERRRSHAAGIDVARVRRDQRLGRGLGRRGPGEEPRNLRPQPLGLAGIELARHCRRPDFFSRRSHAHLGVLPRESQM
jgi:hypothetical protein